MPSATLSSLYPKHQSREQQYSALTKTQLRAIAHIMEALPSLVELEGDDIPVVQRAFRNYWSKQLD